MNIIKPLLQKALLAAMAVTTLYSPLAAAEVFEFTGKLSAYDYDISYRKFYMEDVQYFCGNKTQVYAYIHPQQAHAKFDNILRAAFHANKLVTIKTELANNQCSITAVQVYQHAQYAKLKQ